MSENTCVIEPKLHSEEVFLKKHPHTACYLEQPDLLKAIVSASVGQHMAQNVSLIPQIIFSCF